MRIGPKTRKFLKGVRTGFEATKRGYGKTVGFVQKYAPMAEERLGRVATMTTESFRPVRMEPNPEAFMPMPMPKRRMVSMPRLAPGVKLYGRRHDFGSLTFDI